MFKYIFSLAILMSITTVASVRLSTQMKAMEDLQNQILIQERELAKWDWWKAAIEWWGNNRSFVMAAIKDGKGSIAPIIKAYKAGNTKEALKLCKEAYVRILKATKKGAKTADKSPKAGDEKQKAGVQLLEYPTMAKD